MSVELTFSNTDEMLGEIDKLVDLARTKGLSRIEIDGFFAADLLPTIELPKPPMTQAEAERRDHARKADPIKSRLDEEDEILFGDSQHG